MTMSLYRTDKDVSTAAAEVMFVLAPAYLIGVCCAGLLGVVRTRSHNHRSRIWLSRSLLADGLCAVRSSAVDIGCHLQKHVTKDLLVYPVNY